MNTITMNREKDQENQIPSFWMEVVHLKRQYVGFVHRSRVGVCSCVGASVRDPSTLSTLSMAVPFFLARYAQVTLTEVISSQYDNTLILQRHSQNRWRRRRTRGLERRKERKKEEEKKVWSDDEGKCGRPRLQDQSGCALSAEEECRVEGERVKNKKTNTGGDKWERTPCARQGNEAIGIPDLAMNSRRLSYRSSHVLADSITLVRRVSHRQMLHVVAEWGQLCLICDQPWGGKIIYKCFQEFTAFLELKTQNTHYVWPSVGMQAWPIHNPSPHNLECYLKPACVTKPLNKIY